MTSGFFFTKTTRNKLIKKWFFWDDLIFGKNFGWKARLLGSGTVISSHKSRVPSLTSEIGSWILSPTKKCRVSLFGYATWRCSTKKMYFDEEKVTGRKCRGNEFLQEKSCDFRDFFFMRKFAFWLIPTLIPVTFNLLEKNIFSCFYVLRFFISE